MALHYTVIIDETILWNQLWAYNLLLSINQTLMVFKVWSWLLFWCSGNSSCCSLLYDASHIDNCDKQIENSQLIEWQDKEEVFRGTVSNVISAKPYFTSPIVQRVLYDEKTSHSRLYLQHGSRAQFLNRLHDVDDYFLDGVRSQCETIWGSCSERARGNQRMFL